MPWPVKPIEIVWYTIQTRKHNIIKHGYYWYYIFMQWRRHIIKTLKSHNRLFLMFAHLNCIAIQHFKMFKCVAIVYSVVKVKSFSNITRLGPLETATKVSVKKSRYVFERDWPCKNLPLEKKLQYHDYEKGKYSFFFSQSLCCIPSRKGQNRKWPQF